MSQRIYSSTMNHILSNLYFFEPLMKYEWVIIWLIGQLLERWIFNYYHFWIVGPLTLNIYYSILLLYFYCYSIFIPSKYAFLLYQSLFCVFLYISLSICLLCTYSIIYAPFTKYFWEFRTDQVLYRVFNKLSFGNAERKWQRQFDTNTS